MYVLTPELYSTKYRAVGLGSASVVTRMGGERSGRVRALKRLYRQPVLFVFDSWYCFYLFRFLSLVSFRSRFLLRVVV